MRRQVRNELAAGESDAEVRHYFTARYGDWILLDTPRRGIGWLLWLAPVVALLAGMAVFGGLLRRRTRQRPPDTPLTAADWAAAASFADAPPGLPFSEPLSAALADFRAARVESELDSAAGSSADQALGRLAVALRDYPPPATELVGQPETNTDSRAETATASLPVTTSPSADTVRKRKRAVRYMRPAAALIFAGLLTWTLTTAIGHRAAGTVATGNFSAVSPNLPNANQTALDALKKAVRGAPTDPRAWLAYATALDDAGQLATAEGLYRRSLALDPHNVIARERLSWLLVRGGSPKEALTVLSPVTQANGNDPQLLLYLGLAQRAANDPRAVATLRSYLQLAPSGAAAAMVRALLGAQK
jgi:cytochrome c-type biogenesis protein CcmH